MSFDDKTWRTVGRVDNRSIEASERGQNGNLHQAGYLEAHRPVERIFVKQSVPVESYVVCPSNLSDLDLDGD